MSEHKTESAERDVPLQLFASSNEKKAPSVDMNQVVGAQDILFICLDTLRYDAAVEEEAAGGTPVLNRYGPWEKCQAPGKIYAGRIFPYLQRFAWRKKADYYFIR